MALFNRKTKTGCLRQGRYQSEDSGKMGGPPPPCANACRSTRQEICVGRGPIGVVDTPPSTISRKNASALAKDLAGIMCLFSLYMDVLLRLQKQWDRLVPL